MGRKRIKQYLMLLLVVGVIAVVASGGGGTFASFSAETTNSGNLFATGTLILNDNGGTTTCSSASSSVSTNFTATDCDTLFTVSSGSSFTYAKTTLGAAASGSPATINLTAVSGAPIYKFDKLCFTSAPTDCLTAGAFLAAGSSNASFPVTGTLTGSYSTGAGVVDNSPTTFAKLTLQNAGTLDASGISFKSSAICTDAYGGGNTTLSANQSAGASSTTQLTVASSAGFTAGDSVVVAQSGHAQTFVVSSIPDGTHINVTAAQNWNFAYTSVGATVTGPRLNGGSPQALCANLKMTMTETDSTQNLNLSTAAGCAYTVTNTNPVATSACDFSGGQPLSTLPTSLTGLTLAGGAGTGNTGSLLSKGGGTRYFLIAVHYTGSNFDNTYQNIKTTTFNLTWHIDQA